MQSKRVGDILKNCNDNPDAVRYKYFTIIPGKSNVIISAPHAYEHIRNGKRKPKDKRTLTIAKMISELTNAHVIYTNKDIPYDPNFTPDNKYQKELVSYIQNNNIKYLIDIHGTRLVRDAHLEIGTNELDNFNHDETLLDNLVSIFEKNKIEKIRIDKRFKGSNNTICNIINNKTGIQTIQLEISKKYRSIKNGFQDFKTIINALLDVIYYLERREIMENINFVEKYDETLDIKPAYGYNRVLNKIGYDRVGLEIEVSVSFERNSYSFIRKMLKKIKELVGDNGYFVKDNTVLGDYNFEIVLDPLTIPEIKELYASLLEIIRFSNGAIEISKEKNCGIHMNFNRADITDLNESHKRLTAFVSEHPSYFDENIYKQFKFIWDFKKFQQYQNKVGDKYLWVNYLKSKVVEVRSIKSALSADEIAIVLTGFLHALFYDKEVEPINDVVYRQLDKIYDTVFDDARNKDVFNAISSDGFVIISFKNDKAGIIKPNQDLLEQIKAII